MDIELSDIAPMVERLIADESFRVIRATEMVWDTYVSELPYDFSDQCNAKSAVILEDVVRNNMHNGLPTDDFVSIWAEELLFDVDFTELAERLGASTTI